MAETWGEGERDKAEEAGRWRTDREGMGCGWGLSSSESVSLSPSKELRWEILHLQNTLLWVQLCSPRNSYVEILTP